RQNIGLTENPETNCYRLIHAEGDGLPGLIVDIYHKTAVVQCHSIGMHKSRQQITNALEEILGNRLEAVYDKSAASLPSKYAASVENGYLWGKSQSSLVNEYSNIFFVDWEEGQKTGFFLDQRENRQLLTKYASGKNVLNAFCYSGGFSIYALKAGARLVHSVDISQKAIDLVLKNVALNDGFAGAHEAYVSDVLKYLQTAETTYDLMIVDPPAYAKSLSKRHSAVQGYK